jgi:hypothetical protein
MMIIFINVYLISNLWKYTNSEQGVMRKCDNRGVKSEKRRRPVMSLSMSAFCILSFGCWYQQVTLPLLLESSGVSAVMH